MGRVSLRPKVGESSEREESMLVVVVVDATVLLLEQKVFIGRGLKLLLSARPFGFM